LREQQPSGEVPAQLRVSLLWPGREPVLGAVQGIVLKRGGTTPVGVALVPVARSVVITSASRLVPVGGSLQLSAQGRDRMGNPVPGLAFAWASSNTAVATVNGSGLVVGRAAGEVRITATSGEVSGTAVVEVAAPGSDVVVFNDVNVFDERAMENVSNRTLVRNLVAYPTPNPRGSASVVWFDFGRNTACAAFNDYCRTNTATMRTVIRQAGYSVVEVHSSSGSMTAIPANVKVIFLWLPTVGFTTAEINALKRFAAEGGRVVFVGEHQGACAAGIAVENGFLRSMGAVMTNVGQAVDCVDSSGNYVDLPASSLRAHQITRGMSGVRVACASVIVPGPNDYPLFYDASNTRVLAGVARIDIRPVQAVVMVEAPVLASAVIQGELRLDGGPRLDRGVR
jgi:hypothetical protein